MRYVETGKLRDREFRRLTGVKRKTFAWMMKILNEAEVERRQKGGHESETPIEDMLLMALEYWREYRTYFHIAQDFGVHETTVIRMTKWVENVLVKDGAFSLPGKKKLVENGCELKIVQVDATETPVERPKRGRNCGTQERKNDTP